MGQVDKKELPAAVKAFLSRNGVKGGSVKSDKKAIAVRKNGCAPCKPGKFRGRPPKTGSKMVQYRPE